MHATPKSSLGILGPSIKEKRNSSTTTSNHAMARWMQEVSAFIANMQQNKEEESDDDSGFDLALPGSRGDISPLTAYTRKPVSVCYYIIFRCNRNVSLPITALMVLRAGNRRGSQ
ncbi:hypothetical protein IV203_025319 [Nitzschia inconspicua]|uniref:Uncharacterized protein n=1 Tax=Nitzschia inconspicua TaxID=303405 RepID=A0A9K3LHB7_9STRA|nr:hypothetical protein IV203_024675 [Nitzschia inconspicua]KAG7362435.1 hypothetical protein IV203_025319 [Nitzschia inconspicua]